MWRKSRSREPGKAPAALEDNPQEPSLAPTFLPDGRRTCTSLVGELGPGRIRRELSNPWDQTAGSTSEGRMARRHGTGIPGLSFSWKRALGISQTQAKLFRQIGVPLSRSGRQRKIGRGLGCCIPLIRLTFGDYGLIKLLGSL